MKTTIALLLALTVVPGCAMFHKSSRAADPSDRAAALAAELDDSLRIQALRNGELGVLTFVDLNDLERAAPVGRYLQERLVNELFRRNFRVVEIRLGKEISSAPVVGETALTRVREQLKAGINPNLKSVVIGTYIETASGLQVSARLVELETSQVRASGEVFIARGKLLRSLLTPTASGPELADLSKAREVYERMPVLPEAD